MASILVLNGPNLNLLGSRQPEIYGSQTLVEIVDDAKAHAEALSVSLDALQSNHEGELVSAIHAAKDIHDVIVLNAGAYTHTSIAIADALTSVGIPAIELHLSNVHAREDFRKQSYLSAVTVGQISGFGAFGYRMAVEAAVNIIRSS